MFEMESDRQSVCQWLRVKILYCKGCSIFQTRGSVGWASTPVETSQIKKLPMTLITLFSCAQSISGRLKVSQTSETGLEFTIKTVDFLIHIFHHFSIQALALFFFCYSPGLRQDCHSIPDASDVCWTFVLCYSSNSVHSVPSRRSLVLVVFRHVSVVYIFVCILQKLMTILIIT